MSMFKSHLLAGSLTLSLYLPLDRYKFIDDLSILEVINLLTIGISSYNFRNHVASDIGVNQSYVDSSHLQSQKSIDKINRWTTENKMKLNEKKTNIMIFNYTNNYQFATRIKINETILETLEQTKLLGVIISSDLTWRENTKMLIRKAYGRMEIIRRGALYKDLLGC